MELSMGKILLILLVAVLIFGTARLPKLGEDVGKALRGFKKAVRESDSPAGQDPK
jgi:sec-independent protein translocase protein TatA